MILYAVISLFGTESFFNPFIALFCCDFRSYSGDLVNSLPLAMPVLQVSPNTVQCCDPPTNTVAPSSDHNSECNPSSSKPGDQPPPGGDLQNQEPEPPSVGDAADLESSVEPMSEPTEQDTVVEYSEVSSDDNNDVSEPDGGRPRNVRSLSEELAAAMSADVPPASPPGNEEEEDREFAEVFEINGNMIATAGEEPEMMDISLSSGQYENEETASVVSSNLPTEENVTPSGELPTICTPDDKDSLEDAEEPSGVTRPGEVVVGNAAVGEVATEGNISHADHEMENKEGSPGEEVQNKDAASVEVQEDNVTISPESNTTMASPDEPVGNVSNDSAESCLSGKETEVVASWKTFSDLASANPNDAQVQRPTNDEILEKKATLQLKSLPSNQLSAKSSGSLSAAIFSQSSVEIVYKKPGKLDVIREESESCAEDSVDGSPVLRSKAKLVSNAVSSSSVKPPHSGPSSISSPATRPSGLVTSVTTSIQAPVKPLRPSVLGIRTQYNVPRKLSPMSRSSRSPQPKAPALSPLSEGKACSPSGRGRQPVLGKRSAWRRLSLPASLSPKEGIFPRPLHFASPRDRSPSSLSTRSLPAVLSHSDKYKARSPLTPEADYNFARRYVPRASGKLKSPSREVTTPKVTEFLKRRKLREYQSHHPHYYHHSPAYANSGHIHTLTVTRGKAAENRELKLTPVRVDKSPLDAQTTSLSLDHAFPERWVNPGGEMLIRPSMVRSVSSSDQVNCEAAPRAQSEPASPANSPDSLDSEPPVTTSTPTILAAAGLPSPGAHLQYYFMPEGTEKKTFISAEELCLSPGEIRRGSIIYVPEDPESQSSLSWDSYSELSAFDMASSQGSVTSISSGQLAQNTGSSSLVVTFSTSAVTSSVASVVSTTFLPSPGVAGKSWWRGNIAVLMGFPLPEFISLEELDFYSHFHFHLGFRREWTEFCMLFSFRNGTSIMPCRL